jgi:hypothetical protein
MIYLLYAGYDGHGDAAMSEVDALEECERLNRISPIGPWSYEPVRIINDADDKLRAEVEALHTRVKELEARCQRCA